MDPRRPFNPNTPVHPTNQPPFGFPSTPGTPSSQPFPGFNTQTGFNPWQMQVQHHQWHMPQHQWQPQPQTQTQPEHDFVSLASHDDHVPETQVPPPITEPARTKKTTKKGGKKRAQDEGPSTRADPIHWEPNELEALAKAWVITSTDPILATNRKRDGFWNQVVKEFYKLLQREQNRTTHSVSSKCREMMGKCQGFAGYHQHAWNNRTTGQSDENVLKVALETYTDKNGAFGLMKPYDIFSKCEKFKVVDNEVEKAKRSKTSTSGSYSGGRSDARCTININDDPEFEDEAPTPRSVRPPGRDTAKKAASGGKGKRVETGSGSGSKEVKDKAVEKIELLLQNFNEFKQEQTKRYLERKKEKEEARARDIERLNMEKKEKEETAAREAMRLELERKRLEMEMSRQEATELALMQAPLDNLTEEERKVAAKVKDNIIKRWLGGSMNM